MLNAAGIQKKWAVETMPEARIMGDAVMTRFVIEFHLRVSRRLQEPPREDIGLKPLCTTFVLPFSRRVHLNGQCERLHC